MKTRVMFSALEESLSVAFFLLIFLLMSMGVFLRYLFGISFAWNIELSQYSFVWLTFVGAAYVRKNQSHIKLDLIYNSIQERAPMAVRQGVWIVKELLMLGYLAALVVLGFELAIKSMRFMSQAMQLSQFYLYLSTPVGSLLFLIRELILIRRTYVKDFGGRSGDPA